jgi:hypothetical protein
MFDLIPLHQEVLCFMLNTLNLIEVPSISLMNPSHPIHVLLPFLSTQMLVTILICLNLCYHVLLYVVHTPIMLHTYIPFFLLPNSHLYILDPPPNIFSIISTPFIPHTSKATFQMDATICSHFLFL